MLPAGDTLDRATRLHGCRRNLTDNDRVGRVRAGTGGLVFDRIGVRTGVEHQLTAPTSASEYESTTPQTQGSARHTSAVR